MNDGYECIGPQPGDSIELTLDMAPPASGWKQDARLRIQSLFDLGESVWTAVFNGIPLVETADRSEPYATPYPNLLGTSEQHRAWIVPASLLHNGRNTTAITYESGQAKPRLTFLDVACPT